MGYNLKKWRKRIMNRTDITAHITHLTRNSNERTTIENLVKIINEGVLKGSTNSGFVRGSERAVCFQDAPLNSVAQNLFHEQVYREELGGKRRYNPCGLSFNKKYLFDKGARPVIYDTNENALEKFPDELWRCVTFDLKDEDRIIDWTHEREWRIKGDLHFELKDVFVILTNGTAYNNFISTVDNKIIKEIGGITLLSTILE